MNAGATTSTRTGPDNSEITTTTDANGVKTETRVFRDNPRVSKVVVTTRNGQRTVRVYSPSGQDKEVNDVGDALEVTGDKIADAAGWVADKSVDAAKATGSALETAGEKTVEGAKTVGEKTAEGAKTVGEKTAEGAKTVGKKTAEGAKKTASAIKKAVTPYLLYKGRQRRGTVTYWPSFLFAPDHGDCADSPMHLLKQGVNKREEPSVRNCRRQHLSLQVRDAILCHARQGFSWVGSRS
jgi:hypothetical protein